MKKRSSFRLAWAWLFVLATTIGNSQGRTELRIDPLLLVSLKECRNISQSLGNKLFPGWDVRTLPVLFYKPDVQELLIKYPHKPKDFSLYTGFNPLGDDTIYVRNDTTFITADDQNTSREIEGVSVLVVADPDSRMRNQLRGTFFNHPQDVVRQWLDQWNFLQSPYDEIGLILHEGFHVYQRKMAPDKEANEMIVAQYPLLDPVNNALFVLEGNILRDALLLRERDTRLAKIREFAAVRSFRQSRLDSNYVEYENLTEYNEGLAKYVEYRFMMLGESIEPVKEMYYRSGFNGYRGVLPKQFERAMHNMVNVVAVNDDRFGNKFGSGPLRFKLYETGACQALLLDETLPAWKEKIFGENVFLSELLQESLRLSTSDLQRYLARAKSEYKYEEAYKTKLQFEAEGRKRIEEKVASILQTDRTLVRISYAGFVERIGLAGFTPFGVTQIGKRSAIYNLTPIKIIFGEGVELQMKQVIPVLIDREKKMIAFAVTTPASAIEIATENRLETDQFRFSFSKMDMRQEGNTIQINLK